MLFSSRSREERCRASKTGRRARRVCRSPISPFASSRHVCPRADRYLARSNCCVFNNDVNERCVSRVRWAQLDSTTSLGPELGPTWRVANPIKGKSNLSPDSSFSLFLSLSLSSLSLSRFPSFNLRWNGLVLDTDGDTDRRARVPCSRLRERDEKNVVRTHGQQRLILCVSRHFIGNDAFFAIQYLMTFFAGYRIQQMSQRTFSASLVETNDKGINNACYLRESTNKIGVNPICIIWHLIYILDIQVF